MNRRIFGSAAVAATLAGTLSGSLASNLWAATRRVNSTINGVKVGVITYSYRDLPREPGEDLLGPGIRGCVNSGIGEVELWATMVQPPTILQRNGQYAIDPAKPEMVKAREDVRRWRLETPDAYWRGIRKRIDTAGLNLFAYSLTLADDFTDEEVAATFRAMRSMGVSLLGTNQTRVAMGKRVVPIVEKHGVKLCFHNHSNLSHKNEIASIDSMHEVLAMSRNYMINLDVGHFVGANLDPVDFIRRNHDRIAYLHLKDRKRDNGENLAWGRGDTPLKEVLQLVQRQRYAIPCLIELEYKSDASPLVEVGKCMEYIRAALA